VHLNGFAANRYFICAVKSKMKPKRLVVFVYMLALAFPPAARNQAQNPPIPSQQAGTTADDARYPCRNVHTFDFWVGIFDATPWNQPTAPSKGQLHNTREYDGCVIVERWTSVNGSAGMSMSFYDINRHLWRMVWNDDSNQSNDLEGSYSDGAMRFQGWVLDSTGKRLLTSNVLQNVAPDTIRHIYSTSADNGKTWIVKSDGRFVRR
jgi:hypothetical protein